MQKIKDPEENEELNALKDSKEAEHPSLRDEWMTLPPKHGVAARIDPTQVRARKFNTSVGAKVRNGAEGNNNTWTETPEEKRKRLENEILGIDSSATVKGPSTSEKKSTRIDEGIAKKIKEHNVRYLLAYA
jgi:hypothetical protein